MAIQVTEYIFLENFADPYNIPVPRYIDGTAKRSEIKKALEEWGGKNLCSV